MDDKREQPQQGLADDRADVSNKEPLRKCSEEDNDAIKGTATEAAAAKIATKKDALEEATRKATLEEALEKTATEKAAADKAAEEVNSEEGDTTPKRHPLIGRSQGKASLWDNKENRPEEEQPEGATKAKETTEPKETTNNKAPPEL